jgi:L-fuconolactonase
MPAFPIVDSHVHLWDPARIPLRWGAKAPAINTPHLIAEYDAARGEVAIEAMVFLECDVEAGRHLDEAAMIAEIAAGEPRLKAMVAHAPLEKGEAVALDLDVLSRFPLLRGVRRLLQDEPDIQAVLNADFIAGLNLLPRYNLHFEICIYHHQLGAIVDLVRRLPNVTFMLDHIAKPPIKAGGLEPWRTRMAELAALPNVMCKMSGLITEADHASWQPADLKPYIDQVVDVFGFDRLVFGSDWPVLTLAGGLPQWVGILDDALAGASDEDLRYFWVENAQAFYRLDEN